MKRCPRCQIEKSDAEFAPNPKTGKLQSYCKPCRTAYQLERVKAHPDKERERQRKWRQRNWTKERERQYEWRRRNPEKWKAVCARRDKRKRNAAAQKIRTKIRVAVFAHYGEKCACCGENERLFLTIDHINNDGAQHRRAMASLVGKGGTAFFAWLVRSGFPSGFQTLCRNCNWGKHANGGVCPHQDHRRFND